MTEVVYVETCEHTWPLEDPNEEDQRTGTTHRCFLPATHVARDEPHQCGCGLVPAL